MEVFGVSGIGFGTTAVIRDRSSARSRLASKRSMFSADITKS